jgi:hypothetical protein
MAAKLVVTFTDGSAKAYPVRKLTAAGVDPSVKAQVQAWVAGRPYVRTVRGWTLAEGAVVVVTTAKPEARKPAKQAPAKARKAQAQAKAREAVAPRTNRATGKPYTAASRKAWAREYAAMRKAGMGVGTAARKASKSLVVAKRAA